jgi:hypothetical protein
MDSVKGRSLKVYFVVTLAHGDTEIVQSVRFDSVQAAEAALAGFRNGTEAIPTIESDTGDRLTLHRSAVVSCYLSSAAPAQHNGATLAECDDLIERLGQPIYDGPNTFGFIIGQPPYTVSFSPPHDRVIVWECGGSRPNRCMAEWLADGNCRYWPCALHQADLLSTSS